LRHVHVTTAAVEKVKKKSNFNVEKAMQAQKGSKGIDLLFL